MKSHFRKRPGRSEQVSKTRANTSRAKDFSNKQGSKISLFNEILDIEAFIFQKASKSSEILSFDLVSEYFQARNNLSFDQARSLGGPLRLIVQPRPPLRR